MRIVFSHKQLQQLLKSFLDQDESELGKKERDQLLFIWKNKNQNEFLQLMEQITLVFQQKVIKPDCVYWYEVLNAIDTLMASNLSGSSLLEGTQLEQLQVKMEKIIFERALESQQQLKIILKFLACFLHDATNTIYFSSLDRIVEIYKRYPQDPLLRQDVLIVCTNTSLKRPKKSPQTTQRIQLQNNEIMKIWPEIISLFKCKDFLFDLLKNSDQYISFNENINAHIDELKNNEQKQLELQPVINELEILKNIIITQKNLEQVIVLIFEAIILLHHIGDISQNKGRSEQNDLLEKLFPPKSTISQLLSIIKYTHVGKDVQIMSSKILYFFTIIDINVNFDYQDPNDNPYYLEVCKHVDLYITILNAISKYHSYEKLKAYQNTTSMFYSDDIEDLLKQQKSLIGITQEEQIIQGQKSDEYNFEKTEAFKSQKFMNTFFKFLFHLMQIKNRSLQNQLHPQLIKPVLAIMAVYPIQGVYPININCQVKAAQILKDVVKQVNIDETSVVEITIKRLQIELKIIHDDQSQWKKADDDDSECYESITFRQDFIKTCLRLLCYSVIRTDPNAINFNQNFIANSRKILESNIIENEIMQYVFKKNMEENQDMIHRVVEPLILQCLQLVTYVFNDLPQKIPQYLENKLLPSIIDSLTKRIPLQQEMITLITKFLYAICLNSEGQKIVNESGIIESFVKSACESKAYKHIVSQIKTLIFKDQIQTLAMINKDISEKLYSAMLKNFQILAQRAWQITRNYIKMEERCQNDKSLSEDEKAELRAAYDKEQVALEYTFENASYFLWYYAVEEERFEEGNIIEKTIKENKEGIDILLEVIQTPIVASACPNMFPPFIEVTMQILKINGKKAKYEFLKKIGNFLQQQLDNINIATRSKDLDVIDNLEEVVQASDKIVLAELCKDPEQLNLVKHLGAQDQISVTFGKISFYCDILRSTLTSAKQQMLQEDDFKVVFSKMFKLQALINRYHASIYQRELTKEKERFQDLMKTYQPQLDHFDFNGFKDILDPLNELEEAKNLYYKYVIQVIKSMSDKQARINQKTVIELQLEENMSHTSNMCQLAIRKFILQVLKSNKKKYHFSDEIDQNFYQTNGIFGKLIAEEFRDFTTLKEDTESRKDPIYIMKLCCQYSAVLGEFNKILFANFTLGNVLVEFINNKGLDYVEHLVKWIIQTTDLYEQDDTPKRVELCKHLQLLWSHIVDFYYQLIEGNYFGPNHFQHFIIAFKTLPTQAITQKERHSEYDKIVKRAKNFVFQSFTGVLKFLFVDLNKEPALQRLNLNVFAYFDKYSELFFASFIDIYQFACQDTAKYKFSQNYSEHSLDSPFKHQGYNQESFQRNHQRLVEMGFNTNKVTQALEETRNNFDKALEILFNMPSSDENTEEIKKKENKIESNPTEIQQSQDSKNLEQDPDLLYLNILNILKKSFDYFIDFIPSNPKLIDKQKVISCIFFKLGSDTKNQDIKHLLLKIKDKVITKIAQDHQHGVIDRIGILSYSFECLLKYSRGLLLENEDFYRSLDEIIGNFRLTIIKFKNSVSSQEFEQKDQEAFQELIRNVDQVLALFLYIAEETKISSDLNKVEQIIMPESSLMDPIGGLSSQLISLQNLNKQNIFFNNKSQTGDILIKATISHVDLLKAMHQMNPQYESLGNYALHVVIVHAIENLNFFHNIKGFGEFDCQSQFLKNEGLRAIFGIRSISNYASDAQIKPENQTIINEMTIQAKTLLQQLCSNEQSQIKIYENLIKSVLFKQFQERYKKEEGHDIKTVLLTEEIKTNLKQQSKKKQRNSTPNKRSKSEDRFMQGVEPEDKDQNSGIKSRKKQINQIFKKMDYCETSLQEFIQFFNSVMQIQDLKSFLIACQNVCMIKQKLTPQKIEKKDSQIKTEVKEKSLSRKASKKKTKSKEEKKDPEQQEIKEEQKEQQQERVVIMLNPQIMKEMISQITLHYQLGLNDAEAFKQITSGIASKQLQQKLQNEIVFTLLDMIIEQIRDQQMLILQLAKSKQNESFQGLTVNLNDKENMIITPAEKVQKEKYVQDVTSILSHLTFVINQNPNLLSALLKHKDGKTYRFLIRNIYFLMSISMNRIAKTQDQIENQNQVQALIDDRKIDKVQLETINEFFKRLLLDNPHLTVNEKKFKQEARQIFVKEVIRTLCDNSSNKYPKWPLMKIVYNIGAIWLISQMLQEEDKKKDKKDKEDKKLEQLVTSTRNYRNLMRDNILKSIMHECQLSLKGETQQQQFNLMKQIERIQSEVVQSKSFTDNGKTQIYNCMNAFLNVLRPFENSNLFGEKDGEKLADINESNLGFVEHPEHISEIEEQLAEELAEELEGEDESESDDSITEEDELLGSIESQRMHRFSDIEENEDYDDEIDDDEDEDDELDDLSDQPISGISNMINQNDAGSLQDEYGDENLDYGEEIDDDVIDDIIIGEGLGEGDREMQNEESSLSESEEGDSYDDEEQIQRSSEEDYYDEELSNDVEIFIRPQQDNRRGFRRDNDVFSMNNMSVDLFNLPGPQQEDTQLEPELLSEHIRQEQDYENRLSNRFEQRRQERQNVNNQEFFGNILDLIQQVLSPDAMRNAQITISLKDKHEKIQENQPVLHKPSLFLHAIATFIRQIQTQEQIFRQFIKESEYKENRKEQGNQPEESKYAIPPAVQQDLEISQQSQFSNKNPFENSTNQNKSVFGQTPSEQLDQKQEQPSLRQQSEPQRQINPLEGIDPEFLENLDEEGLQSLTDTENLIQRLNSTSQQNAQNLITNMATLIENTRNRNMRNELLRNLPEEVVNQLPSNLFSEAMVVRQLHRNQVGGNEERNRSSDQSNQDIQPTNLQFQLQNIGLPVSDQQQRMPGHYSRSRFVSMDSQINDLAEFSRGAQDPYQNQNEKGANQLSQPSIMNNSLYLNIVKHIDDLVIEMRQQPSFDSKGNDIDKACENIIKQTLLPNDQQPFDLSYGKVAGLIQMLMTWENFQQRGYPILYYEMKESRLHRILMRIPTVRWGFLFSLYFLLKDSVQKLADHIQSELHGKYKLKIVGQQIFKLNVGVGKNKLDMPEFMYCFIVNIKRIFNDINKISSTYILDILRNPQADPMIQFIAMQVSNKIDVKIDSPFLNQIVDQIIIFNDLAQLRPDDIFNSMVPQTDTDAWYEQFIFLIQSSLNRCIQSYQKEKEKEIKDIPIPNNELLQKIEQLLLNKEIPQKRLIFQVKQIFKILAKVDECKQIQNQILRQMLQQALYRFIDTISHHKINMEDLHKEVTTITQILKCATFDNKENQENICDESLFYKIVNYISDLIDQQSVSIHHQSQSFIFKDEFKTIMLVLFMLFEYNLKFIFEEESEIKKAVQRQESNRRGQSPEKVSINIIMQDIEEIKNEIETEKGSKTKERLSLINAIDQHLNMKIKDKKVREDNRLKTIIKFCLEHKKLINNFVRANQQVLNESLKNVILKVPQILDFDNKRLLFRQSIKLLQKKYRLKYIDLSVRRDKVFDDSFEQLRFAPIDRWRGKMNINFVDEAGIDEGGLSREWFILLSKEIFNPDLALFVQSNAGSTYYPNPKSKVQPEFIDLFKFIGRIVGKALYEQQLLDCYFVKAFYKIILGLPLNYHDVEDYDHELYKNLRWSLQNSVEGLGLTFIETQEFFGEMKDIELIEGGKEIEVSDENKYLYVQKIAFSKLYSAIKEQMDAFLKGFYELIPLEYVQIFDNRELELLISGLPSIDIEDLKENTIYTNYTSESPVIKWLFQTLEEFDNSDRAEFIQFVTGSSKVPVEGFRGLRGSRGIQKFQIVKIFTNDFNRLPMAHTCFKQLELPEYPTYEILKERLLTAIKEGKTFGIA